MRDQVRYEAGGRNYLLTGHVMQVSMSGDGKRFAAVDPYGFTVVFASNDLGGLPRLVESLSPSHPTFSVALSPSGRRLAVGTTSTLTAVHDLEATGDGVIALPSPGDGVVRALAFGDEEHLFVGDDTGRVTRWTLSSPPRDEVVIPSGPLVNAIKPLEGGTAFIAARGEEVDLVRLEGQAPSSTTVTSGLGGTTSLALTDDGASLAMGFADGTIRIWSMGDLSRAPVTLEGHGDYVRALAFDRSGEVLVSVGDDGTVRSSTVGSNRLAEIACAVVWRDLTANEVRAYFGAFDVRLPTCPPAEGGGR